MLIFYYFTTLCLKTSKYFKIFTCLSAFNGIILDYIPYFIEYKGYNIRL